MFPLEHTNVATSFQSTKPAALTRVMGLEWHVTNALNHVRISPPSHIP